MADVQVDGIAGDAAGAQLGGQLVHDFLGAVAPLALVVAEGPEGRQRRQARQAGVELHRAQGRLAADEVVIHHPAVRAEEQSVPALLAEVEVGAHGVIEKDAVLRPLVQAEEEGDTLVEGVAVGVEVVVVRAPHLEAAAAQVQVAGFVTQGVEMSMRGHVLEHPDQLIPRAFLQAVPHALGIGAE